LSSSSSSSSRASFWRISRATKHSRYRSLLNLSLELSPRTSLAPPFKFWQYSSRYLKSDFPI
jgi:hypothetical protein